MAVLTYIHIFLLLLLKYSGLMQKYLMFLKLLTRILDVETKTSCFTTIRKFLDKFDEIKQNTAILSFVTKTFWANANEENYYNEIETDENICRHAKAKKIEIIKQFSCNLSLKRMLSLIKSRIRVYTLISSFFTKIFWISASYCQW